jgi:hypothetical protein
MTEIFGTEEKQREEYMKIMQLFTDSARSAGHHRDVICSWEFIPVLAEGRAIRAEWDAYPYSRHDTFISNIGRSPVISCHCRTGDWARQLSPVKYNGFQVLCRNTNKGVEQWMNSKIEWF